MEEGDEGGLRDHGYTGDLLGYNTNDPFVEECCTLPSPGHSIWNGIHSIWTICSFHMDWNSFHMDWDSFHMDWDSIWTITHSIWIPGGLLDNRNGENKIILIHSNTIYFI